MLFDARSAVRNKQRCAKFFFKDWFHSGAIELCDRLLDVQRNFPRALEIGAQCNLFRQTLRSTAASKIDRFESAGWHHALLTDQDQSIEEDPTTWPFDLARYNLVISNGLLHRLEDPLSHLGACRSLLEPDGLLLGFFWGESHFKDAAEAMLEAELACRKRVYPRFHPRLTMVDFGMLLMKSGFVLPVIERCEHTLVYDNVFNFAHDMRACGETNILSARKKTFTSRAVFFEWQKALIRRGCTQPREEQGTGRNQSSEEKALVFKTEMIIFLAWAPHHSQPRPLRPGQGKIALDEAVQGKIKKL